MECAKAVRLLRSKARPSEREGMARFGINVSNALCVSIPEIRKIAARAGRDHALALALWKTGIHEARILAGMVDEPNAVSESQMDRWANDFDSWDICDQCCSNLFDKTKFAWAKAFKWPKSGREFVKRAGFVMMACLAVHDKKAKDSKFRKFFPMIERGAGDERNFVKKAVNWALRQIGKRSPELRREAIRAALRIKKQGSKPAKWIASDALRELKERR